MTPPPPPSQPLPHEPDKSKYYEQALTEIETNSLVKSTWAMAYSEADGDENKAKARYIRMRVEQFDQEQQASEAEVRKAIEIAKQGLAKREERENSPEAYRVASELIGQHKDYKDYDFRRATILIHELGGEIVKNKSFMGWISSLNVRLYDNKYEFKEVYTFAKWVVTEIAPRVITEYEASR